MTAVTLDKPYVIRPSTTELTSTEFVVTYISENYGLDINNRAPGRSNSVEANVVLSTDPYVEHRMTVWEGDEYLAVKGTWTDQDLYNKIKQILEA
jgi:hypothetical protein